MRGGSNRGHLLGMHTVYTLMYTTPIGSCSLTLYVRLVL